MTVSTVSERIANVSRSELYFPRAGTPANVLAAYKALRQLNPALLVTYNWGAIEWALAAAFTNIPYIHVVDGFGPEEAERQLARRVWFRRLALARCSRVVVPSRTLYRLAKEVWRLPEERIVYIPNGVDPVRFARTPMCSSCPNLEFPEIGPSLARSQLCARKEHHSLPRGRCTGRQANAVSFGHCG